MQWKTMLILEYLIVGGVFIWGAVDIYGWYRFGRNPKIDWTASVLRWWQIKSQVATQPERMLKLFPWLSKDLSEEWGVSDEDGEIT